MKLAEALQERADLNRRIEQLQSRINNNVVMQEGVEPVEQPVSLFKELDSCLNRMEQLMLAINITNMATQVEGRPLTALLARRDVMKQRISILRNAVNCASNLSQRSRGDEIRQLATIDVKAVLKQVDELSRAFRVLDNTIQAANWTTDLME